MNNVQSTKILKGLRENIFSEFLEEIKADGTWRNWLNKDSELHVSGVCKFLGQKEGNKTWDSGFMRGSGWGVHYKNEFNKWVYAELFGNIDGEKLSNLEMTDILPSWLNVAGLPKDVKKFVIDQVKENRRLSETILFLNSQLEAVKLDLLNLDTRLATIRSAHHVIDEHYMMSIRTLTYV
ncbi:hypothetical protein [Pelosinus sp. sgz500959]|uniref:hypothetical protein n=1 Tax=Pelosinus sp. sgz500959 TaxID=3242472 RepID=UPI00366B1D9D